MKKNLSRLFWVTVWALVILGLYAMAFHLDWVVTGEVGAL